MLAKILRDVHMSVTELRQLTDVDGDEIALIERAAVAAGAAYARFHAAALRERVAALEDENAQLKAAVTA